MASTQRLGQPIISRNGNRGMRIRHRELVQSVSGSVAFTATSFSVNPGLATTFPWLAPQAVQWEQYRFHKLRFCYITRTSTATVGSLILAPDYDPSDSPPSSEAQMTTFQDAIEDAAWKDICCELDPKCMFPIGPRKFIRDSVVPGGDDIKTYDAAAFYLATVDFTGATGIGKLWVEYDVEFFVPQSGDGTQVSRCISAFQLGVAQALATGVAESIVFDTSIADPLGVSLPSVAGVFTPPKGVYHIRASAIVAYTAAGQADALIQIFKNGAALTIPATGRFTSSDTVGNSQRLQVTVESIVALSGTETCEIVVTGTQAAGTISVIANGSQVWFQTA